MSDTPPCQPASPRAALAEALSVDLFAQRRQIDDPDVAALLHRLAFGPTAAAVARWERSQPKQRTLRPGETSVRADTGDPHAALVSKLEELARRMGEEAARISQPGADTPPGQFSTDDASADPEAVKSLLTASVAKLERLERQRKLTSLEKSTLEKARGELRGARESLRVLIGDRADDLRELRAKRERDKLRVLPHQTAWHHDAAGTELVDDAGSGLADLMGDGEGF